MKQLALLLLLLSLGRAFGASQTAADFAKATIVVYNRADLDAPGLARFYAQERNIPDDHLVGLDCSAEEEISRQEYDGTIAEPLRKVFAERKWWALRTTADGRSVVGSNQIDFVALVRGIPLKIRSTVTYPGDHPQNNQVGSQNQASVDSELAILGLMSRQISGAAPNPYFQSFRAIGELDDSPIMLVCRLDGPSAAVVRRMISDAVETEKNGLWGRAYVDSAHNSATGFVEGDEWLQSVTKDLRQAGIPVVYDTDPAVFPAGFPMNDCALYYGWYAGGVTGPFSDPGFAFARGAVAVHIHSFSANTLRDAAANWVAPLLSKGAAASLGNVYEPYLQLTTHLDIFNNRLLHGFTFAESAYMATRALSWMTVAVGDPLYRPYGAWLQIGGPRDSRSDWRMYHDFAQKSTTKNPAEYFTAARQAAARGGNGPMMEDLGLMQKEAGNFDAAISCLQQARGFYKKRDDILRAILEQVDTLIKTDKKKAALALVRNVSPVVADAAAAALFRKLEQELTPAPPTPTAKPTP